MMDFPSAQPKPPADGKIIIYPPGVKEITDKITNDEVVKRLKVGRFVVILACHSAPVLALPAFGPPAHSATHQPWLE